jgi:hypothetical protein
MENSEIREIINSYSWIKVKRFSPDNHVNDWEGEYARLEKHHKAETEFLINKCRELAVELFRSQNPRTLVVTQEMINDLCKLNISVWEDLKKANPDMLILK